MQLAFFDADGNGDDSIDVAFVTAEGNAFPDGLNFRTRIIYDATLKLVEEFSRSWDADIINVPIDPSNNDRYGFTPKAKFQIFMNSSFDFCTKLKGAIPYYCGGILDQSKNEAGNWFLNVQLYEPKFANGDDVKIRSAGSTYLGTVEGCKGDGSYTIKLKESYPNLSPIVTVENESMLE